MHLVAVRFAMQGVTGTHTQDNSATQLCIQAEPSMRRCYIGSLAGGQHVGDDQHDMLSL